jgi:hypothetical protein
LVKFLKLGFLLRRELVLGDDDEVDVAVGVRVADRERPLEVGTAQVVGQNSVAPLTSSTNSWFRSSKGVTSASLGKVRAAFSPRRN